MNIDKLKAAEATFLQRYPEGFGDPGLAHIKKSHNVDRLEAFAKQELTPLTFAQPDQFSNILLTIIKRSSMVSRFEKPPFDRFINDLSNDDREYLAGAFERRLTGTMNQKGAAFDEIVELLRRHKLARWSVVSAVPFYYAPGREAFVKPTTAKQVLRVLEVDELHYQALPTWDFYRGYQKLLTEIRRQVDKRLAPNNAALTGFLMTTL